MKKLLNISVIAALAILPLAANADNLTPEQLAYADPATDDGKTVATTKYVKGAYNELGKAINTKQDKLTTDQLNAIENVSGLATRLRTAEIDIEALKTAVGDATAGLVKDVADLKTTVGNATAGLVKDVADLQTNKQDKLSETQLKAVDSGITSEKVTLYDNLVKNSANYATKDGVTATIKASSVTVPVLTAWGDTTATNIGASITAAAYTETAPAAEYTEPAAAGE